jgi:hypothetical protein
VEHVLLVQIQTVSLVQLIIYVINVKAALVYLQIKNHASNATLITATAALQTMFAAAVQADILSIMEVKEAVVMSVQ